MMSTAMNSSSSLSHASHKLLMQDNGIGIRRSATRVSVEQCNVTNVSKNAVKGELPALTRRSCSCTGECDTDGVCPGSRGGIFAVPVRYKFRLLIGDGIRISWRCWKEFGLEFTAEALVNVNVKVRKEESVDRIDESAFRSLKI